MSSILPAASILVTPNRESLELLLVRRAESLRFFGGFWAFPGGKSAREDQQLSEQLYPRQDWSSDNHVRFVTAVRELFEETGILLAHQQDGAFVKQMTGLEGWRREVILSSEKFSNLLEHYQLHLCPQDLQLIGEITTPAFTDMRFATTFFMGCLPPGHKATLVPGELVDYAWEDASKMLQRWQAGEVLLSPPTAMTLRAIKHQPVITAPEKLGPSFQAILDGQMHPIYFAPDVQMLPLRTQGLPPSTHTNAFLIGFERAILIDPGPENIEEQNRLFQALDQRLREGLNLHAIVLSHQHPDHIGAVEACAQRYQLPIWAHPITRDKLANRIQINHLINHGDWLDLGKGKETTKNIKLQALHTPGHAAGHLVFFEPHHRILFAGDMVSTQTSILIAPPEGDLDVYLASLHRLMDLDTRLLLPSHGNVTSQPRQLLLDCINHRAKRERLLLSALGPTPRGISELAAELYKGTPREVMPMAERQLLGGLLKLQKEGKVQEMNGGWVGL